MNKLDKINTLMLCDLLKHFKVDSSINPETVKYAIESGNSWILDSEYSFLGQEEPSKNVRDLTVQILNMYRGLSSAYRKLSNEEQSEILKKHDLHITEGNIQLPGFDGNNETEYFSVVQAFWRMNKFVEQNEPLRDSHSETIIAYSQMLSSFKQLNTWDRDCKLTKEEIDEVLSHAPHSF